MRRSRGSIVAALGLAVLAGCARRPVLLELQAALMYDKPAIEAIAYDVTDERDRGGTVVVRVTMTGDPGLAASFDISPGVAEREAMAETSAGRYTGEIALPDTLVGGPFTVIGRLRHDRAGEVSRRDPTPLTIALPR